MTGLCVLGSTGSIGEQALDVAARHAGRFRVVALSAHRSVEKIVEQARRVKPSLVVLGGEDDARRARAELPSETQVASGLEGLLAAVSHPEVSVVVTALVGAVGLLPTLFAIKNGKDVAIANKEPLVMAGELVTAAAREAGVQLLPVDSEHSAIWQCLGGSREAEGRVRRVWLTATGGPFRGKTRTELMSVTPDDAVRHPVWRMGRKISVDSATLMNKGLEVIEASWLFGLPAERFEVLLHPQGTVHSLVEFVDGSVLGQLGPPDMRLPIQYALTHPDRLPSSVRALTPADLSGLTFEAPDPETFPCLALAYRAAQAGGTAPAVLNASNETAVQLFLDRKISFLDIPQLIENALARHTVVPSPSLDQILDADQWSRRQTAALAGIP